MKRLIITLIALFISAVILNAETIIVNWDGTGDYLTIQEGIDAASNGDIVLVYPGTYNEHINYNGKNIVVGSLFFTTQDPSYISQTIIDSDNPNGVVRICDLETHDAVLTGFTIQSNGVDGISCSNSSPQISHNKIGNCNLGIECIEANASISNNEIYDNEIGIKYSCGLYRLPAIGFNTIRNNKSGILCWHSSPIIYHNIISANQNYGIYCTDYSNAEISSNIIEENGKGIRSSLGSYPEMNHNTIARNYIGIFINPVSGGYMINSIVWENTYSILQEFPDDDRNELYVYYSCVEGGLPLWVYDGGGNIDEDPLFVDPENNDYSLFQDSPCIDTGDPNSNPDPDGTCADMGIFTATIENYSLEDRYNWISFPKLNPHNADAYQFFLPLILNGSLRRVIYKDNQLYYDPGVGWVNQIGDLRTIDGYIVEMYNPDNLLVYGYKIKPDTQIPLEEAEPNWVGYFLDYPQYAEDAFASVWEYIEWIKAEEWFIDPSQVQPPYTVEPAELYIVSVSRDCILQWGSGDEEEPVEKPETEYFTYEEEADYQPVTVDTVYGETPVEIGVFVDDICIGASVVEGYPVQILAYVEDDTTRDDNELTFQLYFDNRNEVTQVNGVGVYDPITSSYIPRPIYLNPDDFIVVRLNTEEAPEISQRFALYQNYPNPVRSSTTICFSTTKNTKDAEINIYNIKGQLVKQLSIFNNQSSIEWDGKDNNGSLLSNGIYLYKLTSGEKTAVKKMVLMR
ncbi:MAG: T9SS type A sorting domain-containing protein [Candidatus Cloacimonetes bacterium]|nr:T9SS type A sorting domain-containing protein [Candidatus Cloacimonadota bacterium]